jgi:hypothetical protein
MKKVKIILTAAVVFAVVGTGLAFKASSNLGTLACVAGGAKGTCPASTSYNTSTTSGVFLHCGPANSTTACNSTTTTQVVNVGE